MHPDDAERARTLLAQAGADSGGGLTAEFRLRYADESWRWSEAILTNRLAEPNIEGLVLTCRDISERKAFEEQLAHQAFHDALTGLPNRALFTERLQHALARTRRRQTPLGVIFLDLDNFKVVNDSLGHDAGDRLLVAVAERLAACVRPGDTVARLGGDEFTVLLEDLTDEGEIAGVAERITEVLRAPITVGGREVFTTGSLGIVVYDGDYATPDELVRDADTAMYQAKTSGKAHCVVFDRAMNARALERLELESDLRRALENERVPGLLPADHLPGVGPDQRGGGAGALGTPAARADPARQVHPARRGDRPDRAAGPVGPARSLPAGAGVAG